MRRNIKGVISVFAFCLVLIIISGCQPSGRNVAFFLYNGNDTFITEMMKYMTANMSAGVSFHVRDGFNSQAVQNQQIVDLLDDNLDLFVINAVDRLACGSIVEKCAKENVPIIFFNREPLEDALIGSHMYYVGAAADSLGEKQADMVAEIFTNDFADTKYDAKYDKNEDGVVQLVILKGEQGHQDAEKRTDNCVKRLKERGFQVDVLAIQVANWNRQNAYDAMRLLYSQYGDTIELVFANNDDMALGAIDYLLDAGVFSYRRRGGDYRQPFIIVGVDGTSVGLDAIEKGLLYGTVNNDFAKQSDAILTLADYIMTGRRFDGFPYPVTNDHYIYIDGDVITRKNLGDYYMS